MNKFTRRTALAGLAAVPALSLSMRKAMATPNYYPADYAKTIEASRAEEGVLCYSNVGEMNWRPILQQFNAIYPWINVRTLDLNGNEVFERYYAEQATGNSAVDMVLSHSSSLWLDFVDKGNVVPFTSAEHDKVPDWSKPAPSVYTISADPYLVAYNKLLLAESEWPKSINDMTAMVKADPERFDKKIATGQPMSSAAGANILATYMYGVGVDHAIEQFKVMGPHCDLYRSAGPIMEKITSGEYLMGFSLSAIQLFPLIADPARAEILGWVFPNDGTVMIMRHMAIAKTVKNPNSTKLFIDFCISNAGQTALASGGLMPYRSDVSLPDGPLGWTYQKVAVQIGDEHCLRTTFDPKTLRPSDELVARVKDAFKITG